MIFIKLLFLIFIAQPSFSEVQKSPRVETPLGPIEGDYALSLNGRTFYSFLGVPYAQPPVGNLRFKKPQAVEPWNGTWIAKSKYRCLQYNQFSATGEYTVEGDEDCLYLNVFTPKLQKGANLDVIVFIHGGAFMFNSGAQTGPDYLLDKDVVCVTLNYRLGPLGFLSTEDGVVPGNNGIRDQIMALKWVKDNIEYFGGNPESVTITGMSAGGASVHLHFLSPESEGLFHRGISQSGVALNPWVLMEGALEKTRKLATLVGCPVGDSETIVNCLRSRPGKKIVDQVKEFLPWLYNPFSPFGVVVDKWSPDPVLPDHPFGLLAEGKVKDLPWIVSFTNSEGLYPATDFYHELHLETINEQWNYLMPLILHYDYTVDSDLKDEVSRKIREKYLGSEKVTKSTFMKFVDILSDRLFLDGIEMSAKMQSAAVKSKVFSYFFTYRGARSISEGKYKAQEDLGAAHYDDTCYVFKAEVMPTTTTEEDREMVKMMVEMFTSFAKNGVPNLEGFSWPEVSKHPQDPLVYLRIDSARKLTSEARKSIGNLDFWDSLPLIENKKLFTVIKDEL